MRERTSLSPFQRRAAFFFTLSVVKCAFLFSDYGLKDPTAAQTHQLNKAHRIFQCDNRQHAQGQRHCEAQQRQVVLGDCARTCPDVPDPLDVGLLTFCRVKRTM